VFSKLKKAAIVSVDSGVNSTGLAFTGGAHGLFHANTEFIQPMPKSKTVAQAKRKNDERIIRKPPFQCPYHNTNNTRG
jgi:hypothetical protein